MIELESLPMPVDAPEPQACLRIERPEEGLVRIHLEPPHRPKLAVLDPPLLRDLEAALSELEADSSLRGLVITGREPLSFAGGADIDGIAEVTELEVAERFVRIGQALFQRLHLLGREGGGRVRTVAAVGGPVPGGACELALACDRIVLADHPRSRIGLPEVKLGIFPAWGGTQRLPRRIGVPAALDAILGGKLYPAKKAKRMGIVDRLAKPEYLLRVGDEIAMGRMRCGRKTRSWIQHWFVDRNPLAGAIIANQARKQVLSQTKGHYPAPLVALPLVVRAPRIALRTGLENEVRAIKPLTISPITKSLVGLFQLSEEAKKLGNLPDEQRAPAITRAAVIGAGVMGGGIASLMAEKRVDTRLRDLDPEQLDEAQLAHRAEIEKKRKRRRLDKHLALAAVDRLEVTTEAAGFARCEIVIEAVAEKLEVKRAVFGELAELMPADAILATNTSSLSVDAIAATIPHPERVVGMHFFNPVRKMPLVEIVRGARTSDEVVARTARLAIDLGKTPVVTADVAGFLVNRVLGPYLDESIRLFEAGVDPEAIDAALLAFGMPMGPCELVDEVGLDIALHAGASLEEAYGERMRACTFLKPLVEGGHLGKKNGKGIYLWEKDKRGRPKKAGRNPAAPAPARTSALSAEAIVDRTVLAMVNEAARSLDEKVVAGPRELDLATVFGTGFAPFRGGVLRYADARGPAEIVAALKRIADSADLGEERRERFEAAELLARVGRDGGKFHG